MRVLPVIDLKGGLVVRAVAGRRQEYRPVVSRLTPSSRPIDVAQAFREHLGLDHLYVADLDAIAGNALSLGLYADLQSLGFLLWIDAGLRDEESSRPLVEAGVHRIVAGLETLAGPAALASLCRRFGGRVVFSLDLKDGRPLGDTAEWKDLDPQSLAEEALAQGVQSLILLDLARVGLGAGTGTEVLARRLVEKHPEVEVAIGGGVRDGQDLSRIKRLGVSSVLVASALHDGRITRNDLEALGS